MPITLGELRTRFYQLMDEGQSQYIGTAEANNYINNAAALLHNIVITEDPWRAQKEATLTPVVGTADVPLPADFNKCLRLYLVRNGTYTALRSFNPSQYGQSSLSYRPYDFTRYCIMGNNIKLDPSPNASNPYTLVLWYVPSFSPLVLDTDLLPAFQLSGHEQWVINQAVIYCKIKEEVQIGPLAQMNEAIRMQIMKDLQMRDRGTGNRIVPEVDCSDMVYRVYY